MAGLDERGTLRQERGKPPTPRPVEAVRCYKCGRIVAELAAGSLVRVKCACNAFNVIERQA